MQKTALKKSIALLLSAIIVASTFTSCSQEPKSDSLSSSDSPTTQSKDKGKDDTTATNKETYEFTLLGNLVPEMKEWDKAYVKGLEEKLNLKINVEIPPSTSYAERLQMMLASGEYADLTLFPNHTDKPFLDGVKNGVFIPLNSYIENAPNLKKYSYDISWETLKVMGDENIYGIPRTSIARADGFMLRKDWLEKIGFEGFEEGKSLTIDQITEIATAFTKNDPDGNGAADTFGIGTSSDDLGNIDVLFPSAFGLNGWQEYDGEYMDPKYSKTMDNYKRALEWTQSAWKAGIVDPDWPTVKRDVSLDRFGKGITGIIGEFAGWMIDKEIQGKELNKDYELAYVTSVVEKVGDKYSGGSFSTGFWGEWVIANTAKKPERIIEMLDYALSDEYWDNTKYGYEGLTYTRENGVITPTKDYGGQLFGKAMLRRNDDPSFFVSLALTADNRTRVEDLIGICIDQYEFSLDQGYRPAISDDPTFIDYQKNMLVQISKIIVGELQISEWDKILDGWYKAGGETYVKQMQDYIKSQVK